MINKNSNQGFSLEQWLTGDPLQYYVGMFEETKKMPEFLLSAIMPTVYIEDPEFSWEIIADVLPVSAIGDNPDGIGNPVVRQGLKKYFSETFTFKQHRTLPSALYLALRNGSNASGMATQKIFNDVDMVIMGLQTSLEKFRAQAVQYGKVQMTKANDGIDIDYDFGVPANHKASLQSAPSTEKWSDTENSKPLEDMAEWKKTVEDDMDFLYGMCSQQIMDWLLANKSIKQAYYGTDKMNQPMTVLELNEFLNRKGLPMIMVNKDKYRHAVDFSEVKFWNDNKLVFFGAETIGNIFTSKTQEQEWVEAGINDFQVARTESGLYVTTYENKGNFMKKDFMTIGAVKAMAAVPFNKKLFIADIY